MFMNLLETFTKRYGLKEVLAMPLKKSFNNISPYNRSWTYQ